MAIQLPNPGLGDGQTGDNEFVMWTKVKDNFSNTTHAANRNMGSGISDLSQNSDVIKNGYATEAFPFHNVGSTVDVAALGAGSTIYLNSYTALNRPPKIPCVVRVSKNHHGGARLRQFSYDYLGNDVFSQVVASDGSVVESWVKFYTTGNTTKDGNGFLKAASPVVDLYDNKIELNNDASKQGGITFEKLGTGSYLVKGSLGFAQEGWYIEMPKDANGNVLVAVVYEQLENNDISVKTFDYMLNKKGRIVPDTETPLDIPEGRCINLRLHEELLDEPIE